MNGRHITNRNTRKKTQGEFFLTLFLCLAALLAAIALRLTDAREQNTSPTPGPTETPVPTDTPVPEDYVPWYLILVNRWNPIDESAWTPPELASLSNGKQVDARIYPYLQQMFDDMESEGVYPIAASGYRTREDQQRIYDETVEEYISQGYAPEGARAETEKWVMPPGTSEHQLGLGVDINADGIHSAGYEVYDWLEENAHRYGFIRRYPEAKADITGVENEPWHYRYVGVEAAGEIHSLGVCLEEYMDTQKKTP